MVFVALFAFPNDSSVSLRQSGVARGGDAVGALAKDKSGAFWLCGLEKKDRWCQSGASYSRELELSPL